MPIEDKIPKMIQASPVDPILRIPKDGVDKQGLVERAINKFNQFSIDRIEWMRRREEFYLGWDDYITPARKGLWNGSSNLHLPLTEIQATQMHALVMQAILFNYPWFYIDPQDDVDVSRVQKAERFMKYVLERYTNYNKGIYFAIDDWAWDFVTEGIGILSRSWRLQQRRFITVQENPDFNLQRVDLQKLLEDTEEKEFDRIAKQVIEQPYIEQALIRTVFNGPLVVAEDPAYILFKGDVVDSTDLNEHETVIKVCYFNEQQIIEMAQSQYFDEDASEQILSSDPDRKWSSDVIWGNSSVRRARDIQTGVNTINPSVREREWELLCVWDTTKVDPRQRHLDRIQYFVHPKTRQLARWTYLDRVSSNGKLPLHMGHLFRRPRRSTGRGVVQTFFAMNDAQDILVNQGIDAGMIQNNPMFAFRANGTFDPEEMRIAPGLGVKVDDPNADIRFFTWQTNPSWSLPFQGLIDQFASQLTTIGPQEAGQVGPNVGALRSAAGVNALGSNASKAQNVLINRAKHPISECFEGLYQDCIERMDPKIRITVTGADGIPMFDETGSIVSENIDKEDLRMRLRFGIYANSLNMNHQTQQAQAMAIAQFSFQPMLINSGVVTPQNAYEIMANIHQTMGTLRPDRFITKPEMVRPTPIEWELRMIMSGQMPPIQLNDPEHAQKLEVLAGIDLDAAKLEMQYGKVAPNALQILKAAIDLHTRYLKTAQRPSNVKNPMGSNQSPTLAAPTESESKPETTSPLPSQNIKNVTQNITHEDNGRGGVK